MLSIAIVCANVEAQTTGKLSGAQISLLPMFSLPNYKVDQQADLPKDAAYLFKKKQTITKITKKASAVMSSPDPQRPRPSQLAAASVLPRRVCQHVRAAVPGRGWR